MIDKQQQQQQQQPQQQQQQQQEQEKTMQQQTGELILNRSLEVQKASGEFVNNKYLIENIATIIDTLRLHYAKRLTNDHFLGLTIQFSDHYYKIDLSKGDEKFIIERYMVTLTDKKESNQENSM